jgi:hypothetical protein
MFSVVFVFKKSYIGNILGIGRNKSQSSYFSRHETASKAEMEDARGQPRHRVARVTPGRATRWCGPIVHPLTSPFRLYILLDEKTLRASTLFQKTYCKPPPSSTQDREGPEALPGTLPERRITTGGLLHHHACLRSDV